MTYQRIRDLREDADLTQVEISNILFLHRTTYRRYETGKREIPLSVAVAIARFYGVSLDYLVEIEK